jgi:hypothetical protein
MKITALAVWISLAGCAVSDGLGDRVGPGSAKYTYTRTLADGSKCSVDILSARDVIGGELHVNPDCSIDSRADQTQGAEAALRAVQSALELAKSLAAP